MRSNAYREEPSYSLQGVHWISCYHSGRRWGVPVDESFHSFPRCCIEKNEEGHREWNKHLVCHKYFINIAQNKWFPKQRHGASMEAMLNQVFENLPWRKILWAMMPVLTGKCPCSDTLLPSAYFALSPAVSPEGAVRGSIFFITLARLVSSLCPKGFPWDVEFAVLESI